MLNIISIININISLLLVSPVLWTWFLSLAKKEFRAKLTSKQSFNSGQSESALSKWAIGQAQGCLIFYTRMGYGYKLGQSLTEVASSHLRDLSY